MEYNLISLNESLWQEIVERSPSATFYHTPAWAKILTQTYPTWENATFMMEFEDGNLAVFPLLRRYLFNIKAFPWFESMVPGAYGGPVFRQEPGTDHLLAIEKELKKIKNLQIVGNPFFLWDPDQGFSKLGTFTHILQLNQDYSMVRKNFSKGRRDAISYSKRRGVTVNEADFSKYYQEYYRIYEDQTSRWGGQAGVHYPVRLFEKLAQEAQGNSNIRLWAAWQEGKMVSGVIVFYHNKRVILWHNATLTLSLKFRPVDLLYSTIIESACSNGLKYFDFGKSGGYLGVIQYKDHFGAQRVPITEYRRNNIVGTIFRGVRFIQTYLHHFLQK
ncbi:MAG: GNAT family N-acetyltransferase [Chloroflexota bacterium]